MRYVDNAFEETRTVVFIEPIHKHPHSVIPQLDATIMKRCGEKRLSRMKCESCARFK